jgi:N6-adenosine-specific RNA methylase IME4
MKTQVILADPPWFYRNRHEVRYDGGKGCFGIGVNSRYPKGCMTTQAICDLPVESMAADQAYLFMWSTWTHLPDALEVMKAWGFDYKTVAFVWHKLNKNGDSFYGPGRYVPSNTEPCLFGVRGRPWTPNTGWKPHQVVSAPHPRDSKGKIIHSRKPEEVHQRIERWLHPHSPEGDPWVELFATVDRPGWECFGHSVTGRDIVEDIEDFVLS